MSSDMQETPCKELHQVSKSWSPWQSLSTEWRARFRSLWMWLGFNPETASVVRYELDMVLLRVGCFFSLRHRKQVREFGSRSGLKVHLGCGAAILKDWVNVDCYPPPATDQAEVLTIDVRPGLPFADRSVRALFSEHFIEHLPMKCVRHRLLPDIHRMLEPGGVVRFAVPDGEYFISQYLALKRGEADVLFMNNSTGETGMITLNNVAQGGGHHFLYDFDTFALFLNEAGFAEVSRRQSGDTAYEVFVGLDRRDEWRARMSLYIEARVPE